MKKRIVAMLSIALLVTSCMDNEVPVNIPEQEGYQAVADVGDDYKDQVYFSFSSNSVRFVVDKENYDIKVSMDPSNKYVTLNNANFMTAVELVDQFLS